MVEFGKGSLCLCDFPPFLPLTLVQISWQTGLCLSESTFWYSWAVMLLLSQLLVQTCLQVHFRLWARYQCRLYAKVPTICDNGKSTSTYYSNRELNHLRMNYRFEKIELFHEINSRQHLTNNLRKACHTLYAMLLSNYVIWHHRSVIITIGNNQLLCLVVWQNGIPITSLWNQYDVRVVTVTYIWCY